MRKAPLLLFLSLCGSQLLGGGAKSPNIQKLIDKSTEKYTVQESGVLKRTVSGDVERWDYAGCHWRRLWAASAFLRN
jgi:hypothetical protein